MNRLVWHLVRILIHLRRDRAPPASLKGAIWYFAYGSNMNERLFRERRHMVWSDARGARLDGYRLAFTVAGGRPPGTSAPANIVESPGDAVHGVLYLLPLRKFARLDNSEGKQYEYLWTEVEDTDGTRIPAVTYKVSRSLPEGRPSRAYLNLILEAARQRGLPAHYISSIEGAEARE